jgi:hypothetical protein
VWLIQAAIAVYPNAHYQGLADGAPENWSFLEPVTDTQVLDFFHATQYLDNVAKALHPRNSRHQKSWLDEHCHTLKHEVGAAERLLAEMEPTFRTSNWHIEYFNEAIGFPEVADRALSQ